MENFIVAARNDGFGERMCAMLNAMYIAKKTGWTFKFIWQDPPKLENNDKNILLPWNGMLPQDLMFSREFINKYALKNSPSCNDTLIKTNSHKTLQEAIKNPGKYEWGGGHYSLQEYLAEYFTDIEQKEYANTLQECWNEIKFSSNIQHSITLAKQCKNLPKNFIAIHIRCGDIFINGDIYLARHKAVNVCLVLEIIQKEIQEDKEIILFSDDLEILNTIKQQTNMKFGNKVFIIDDFFKREQHTKLEQSIFEIMAMSQATKIYSGISGFSRLANMIGNNKHITIYRFFDSKAQYKITQQLITQYALPPTHEAFAYLHLFDLIKDLKNTQNLQASYIQKAYSLEPNITALKVLLVYTLLQNKNFKEANQELKTIYHSHKSSYLNDLLREGWKRAGILLYNFTFSGYFQAKPIESFPYIVYFSYIIASKTLNHHYLKCLYKYNPKFYFAILKSLPNFNRVFIAAKQIDPNLPTLSIDISTKSKQIKLLIQYLIHKNFKKLKNSLNKKYRKITKLFTQ